MDFDIRPLSWNQSPADTEGQWYLISIFILQMSFYHFIIVISVIVVVLILLVLVLLLSVSTHNVLTALNSFA